MVTDNSLDKKLIYRDIDSGKQQDHQTYNGQLPFKLFLIHDLSPIRDHLDDRYLFPQIISVDQKACRNTESDDYHKRKYYAESLVFHDFTLHVGNRHSQQSDQKDLDSRNHEKNP